MSNRNDYIEKVICGYLPKECTYQRIIADAVEYSLLAGGKRLRPSFMYEVYTMFGGKDSKIIEPFMAAIEMIHTYSLVHDDLPAMDDDDYRRGKKTTHVVYGEAMGILAGDALLNYAYETACSVFSYTDEPYYAAKALSVLAKKAGIFGMVGGQAVDVKMNGQVPDMDTLMFIYECKTAALLEASFMIGGILAKASDEDVSKLEAVAKKVGIAFQIQDDILDITSTTEALGKPVNSDEKNKKTTYPSFYGLEAAKEAVKKYSKEAEEILSEMNIAGDKRIVSAMIDELIYRKK